MRPEARKDAALARTWYRDVQLVIFEARRDLAAYGRPGLAGRGDPTLGRQIDASVSDHAHRLGWTRKVTMETSSA